MEDKRKTKVLHFVNAEAASDLKKLVHDGKVETAVPNPITKEEAQKMVKLANGGMTPSEISKEIDRNVSTVTRHLKKARIPYKKGWTQITEGEGKRISELAKAGNLPNTIAKTIGRNYHAVQRYLDASGVAHQKGKKVIITKEESNRIRKMAKEKKNLDEIAEAVSRDKSVVWAHLVKKGVKFEKKWNAKRISRKEGEKIVDLAKEGVSLTDIAKTIQRHKSSIKSYLESKGVEYNKNWSVVTSEEGRKIGAMAHEGKNPNEIAREIKRDPVTVKTYLVKNKIPHTKGFKDVSEEEISEIFRLAGEGKGSRVISKELNLPRSTVRHYLKKHTEKSKDNGVNYNRTPYDPKYKIRILPFVDKEAADQVREMVKQKDVQ